MDKVWRGCSVLGGMSLPESLNKHHYTNVLSSFINPPIYLLIDCFSTLFLFLFFPVSLLLVKSTRLFPGAQWDKKCPRITAPSVVRPGSFPPPPTWAPSTSARTGCRAPPRTCYRLPTPTRSPRNTARSTTAPREKVRPWLLPSRCFLLPTRLSVGFSDVSPWWTAPACFTVTLEDEQGMQVVCWRRAATPGWIRKPLSPVLA